MFGKGSSLKAGVLGTFAVLVWAADANALNVTPTIMPVAPPTDVTEGMTESNTAIKLFLETASTTVEGVVVDILAAGPQVFDDSSDLASLGSLTITGTFASYMLHLDSVGTASRTLMGTVEFDRNIVAILLQDVTRTAVLTLDDSDDDFGALGTTYPTGMASKRGLELDFNDDFIQILDSKTLKVQFSVSKAVDQIRVITQPVPEPSALLTFAASGLIVATAARRKSMAALLS